MCWNREHPGAGSIYMTKEHALNVPCTRNITIVAVSMYKSGENEQEYFRLLKMTTLLYFQIGRII
jgi:hypothetical protein